MRFVARSRSSAMAALCHPCRRLATASVSPSRVAPLLLASNRLISGDAMPRFAAPLVAALLGGTLAATPPAQAADPAYTMQTLHFAVQTGPTGETPCDIVGDLYTPTAASPAARVPAILTTNGFGGSKDDQAGLGKAFSARGYVVLSYSGLGFGGSGCKITLDDPDYDGRAATQLISYLGGAGGIAFTDAAHTSAAPPLQVVVHDARDHAGQAR